MVGLGAGAAVGFGVGLLVGVGAVVPVGAFVVVITVVFSGAGAGLSVGLIDGLAVGLVDGMAVGMLVVSGSGCCIITVSETEHEEIGETVGKPGVMKVDKSSAWIWIEKITMNALATSAMMTRMIRDPVGIFFISVRFPFNGRLPS